MFRRLLPLVPLLTGCDALKDWLTEVDGDMETRTSTVESLDGIASVQVEVDGQRSFLLTGTSDKLLAVEAVYDPSGERVMYWEDWYGDQSLTGAIWLEGKNTVLNWPIRAEDGALTAGTWVVDIGVVNAQGYYTDSSVDVNLKLKTDPDLETGTVRARVVYAEGLDQEAEVTQGVERAVERWKEVWAPYGLSLEVEYASSSFSTDQPFPGEGEEHSQVAEGADGKELSVLITETIDGGLDYLGIAGSIPGALSPTDRALLVVSWLGNAGGDGSFSEDDIRLFGETLAHESGHYMGLFHPVEMTWDYWDALSDTASCSSQSACESAMEDNLMFPYPVCDWTSCVAQDQMTDQQVGVKHRYTGTL